jgi:uncharacterized protein (TIGR03435 family)
VKAVIACLVVMVAVAAALPIAQEPRSIKFDVTSVKRSRGDAAEDWVTSPGQIRITNYPLWLVIQTAAQISPDFLIAPDWTRTERYDINARIPPGVTPSPATTMSLFGSLLEDRFKMAAHRETREIPIYNLVLVRNNGEIPPGLKRAPAECPADARLRPDQPPVCNTRAAAGEYSSGNMPMGQLARFLGIRAGRQVVDRTGLTGNFAFSLTYAPEAPSPNARLLGAPDTPAAPPDPNRPALSTALQEQLGLRLEPARGPVEFFVVDRIERPTED